VARWPKVRHCLLPSLSSDGALVDEPSLRFHIPLIEPDVQISRIRLSDETHALRTRRIAQPLTSKVLHNRQRHRSREWHGRHIELLPMPPSLSHVTPSIGRRALPGFDSLRNPLPVPISCVCLELSSLPSTGITRLPRYYEPLRHPAPPDPSLTGVPLTSPRHDTGLPVLRALPLCTCSRYYPGAATGCKLRSLPQPCQPSPQWRTGRPAHRPFRGLLSVHSR
jgi:hypothetical protein